MDNPLINIKIFITNSINSFLKEKFLDESGLTYNYKRKSFQTTILFLQSEKNRSRYKNKLEHFYSNSFDLLVHDNYINFKLSRKMKQIFMAKFIKYIQTLPTSLTTIDYFLYYKRQESLDNIKTKAFMNAQLNLLKFYGYSPNTLIKKELTSTNQVFIDFELDNIKFSYEINNLFNNNSLKTLFSPKYLNLLILSKNINTASYNKKILLKLNTKNPFYITAYVIARLNQLELAHPFDFHQFTDQDTIHFSLLLAEILSSHKSALNIKPLLDILNGICKKIYVNSFYNFDTKKLIYKSNLVNFLTNISQTNFLYY